MPRKTWLAGSLMLIGIVLVGLVIVPGMGRPVFGQAPSAQAPHRGEGGVPTFKLDPSWPKVPAKWKLGSVSSASGDAQDHVWIIHRPGSLPADQRAMAAPSALEFDNAGNFIQAWGKEAEGYEWPRNEHGIHVDYKGYVWVNGTDGVILKFTKAGKFVMQIGRRGQTGDNNSTEYFDKSSGIWVYPKTNELFVSDGYGNNRIVVFDADTGKYKRHWGAYGKKPPAAIDPPRFDPKDEFGVRRAYAESLQQFSTIHDVKVSNDGLVYAADRTNNRIQVFTVDGKYLAQQFVGIDLIAGPRSDLQCRSLAFSADPQQNFLYLAGNPEIFILNRKTLEILGSFVTGDVQEDHPPNHHIATDSKGNIYAASTNRGGKYADSILIHKWVFQGLSPVLTSR